MRRRWLRWAALVLAAAVLIHRGVIDALRDFAHMFLGTPHERYAARFRRGWASERAAARAWLTSAEESLRNRVPANLPRSEELSFRADRPHAVAFFLPLRRGQRFVANAEPKVQGVTTPFLDLFVDEAHLHLLPSGGGNARTTAPHLHFGIYGAGGAVDPLPYVVGMSTRDAGLLRDFQPLRGARLRGALSSRFGPPNVGLARAGMAR